MKPRKFLTVMVFLFIFGLAACRVSVEQPGTEISPVQTQSNQSTNQSSTPTILIVLTNTPQSYPSHLQPWLVGDWQMVNSGEIIHFGEDHRFYQLLPEEGPESWYRFTSETEIVFVWKDEEIQAEIWQVDQNTMFLNTSDGLSNKLIRVSP